MIKVIVGILGMAGVAGMVAQTYPSPGPNSPVSHSGGSPITLISSTAPASGFALTEQTAVSNTSGANLLVVGTAYSTTTNTTTITDGTTSGFTGSLNTWTCTTAASNGTTNGGSQQCYAFSASTSATHYFRVTQTGATGRLSVAEMAFNNTLAGSGVIDGSGTTHAAFSTSCAPGSITPVGAGELFTTIVGGGSLSETFTINASFTIPGGTDTGGWSDALAYFINSGSTAVSPTWTNSASDYTACTMNAFKP